MLHVAIALQVLFVFAASWASLHHFKLGAAGASTGTLILPVMTAAGTVLNCVIALDGPRAAGASIAASIALTLVAFACFTAAVHATRGSGLSHAFDDATPGSIVRAGIYRTIRHPFYTAYCLYWSSWVLLAKLHPASLGVLMLFVAIYVKAASDEEHRLAERHGDDYRSLQNRTWRMFPGLY